ncbi:release factor glutamine methyltransferase [Frondihabitans sucicola]|uniref:Release factor glutamine methyltransferase n=1 Tax=Frondihabitans sucicola TaxID=1268041 RepID=A0ABM8GRF2_9MICO|nr:peptide chain release factor N(5)-glutamine methyltransferase [Frondihabitans sucicola]BDZ51047.1 release factor glutamine methyltransferase [Frondihabitans sucicola]
MLAEGRRILDAAGVPTPAVDAELLLAHVLRIGRGEVAVKAITGGTVSEADASSFQDLVVRRAGREPLQHLTGLAPFRSLELHVGPGVFVPRPETEGVAQIAIDALAARAEAEPIAVDLGTGSGALALALATEVPRSRVYAVELSPEAAVWTRQNIESTGARVSLVEGDLGDALPELDGTVSVVVSNPPYIPVGMVPRDPEVRLHDPALALYGGADGLDVVRRLSRRAHALLVPGGTLVVEHGDEQGRAIRELLTADGWRGAATHPDLTRRDRATTALR